MNSLVLFLKYFHRFVLIAVLVLTAITPIIFNEHILYVFLYLPALLIITGILSMNIENYLNKYRFSTIKQQKSKRIRKCLIKQGLCCLHH